jgi:site-specific recombinase XerC
VWSSSSSARRASKDSDSAGQTDSAFDSDNRWIEVEVEAGAETEAETEAEVTPPRRVRGLPRTFSVEKTSALLSEDTVQVKSALNDTSGHLAALETGS